MAAIDEPGNLHELLAAGLDHEVDGGNAFPVCIFVRRLLGHRNESAALAKHRGRPLQPLPAGRVEDQIHRLHGVLEASPRMIDDLVRSQLADRLDVARRCRPDDIGSALDAPAARHSCQPLPLRRG